MVMVTMTYKKDSGAISEAGVVYLIYGGRCGSVDLSTLDGSDSVIIKGIGASDRNGLLMVGVMSMVMVEAT